MAGKALLTKHAKHFPDCRHAQQILVSQSIADAAEDEAEDEASQVGQARQDSSLGELEHENFAHELGSGGDQEEQAPSAAEVEHEKCIEAWTQQHLAHWRPRRLFTGRHGRSQRLLDQVFLAFRDSRMICWRVTDQIQPEHRHDQGKHCWHVEGKAPAKLLDDETSQRPGQNRPEDSAKQ